MALGETAISKIISAERDIHCALGNDSNWPGMKASWNTFQYVARNLAGWAEDTVIGKELQKEMVALSDALEQLIKKTEQLDLAIVNFANAQRKLNNMQF